jgi:DNA repair protein RadC
MQNHSFNHPSNLPIKSWAESDRPREKLASTGQKSLSDAELLAILISTGQQGETALDLARKLLHHFSNNLHSLGRASVKEISKIKGLGPAKAITIIAALELGQRKKETDNPIREKMTSSRQAFQLFYPILADLTHEQFWLAFLNNANEVLKTAQVSKGGITSTVVDTRLVLKMALEITGCVGIILAHNHPSGSIKASEADKKVTQKIKDAALLLDLQVLDHIIIGGNDYFSFSDEGMI